MLKLVHDAISSKKGENLLFIDLTGVVDYTDVICLANGYTPVHNRAMADAIVESLAKYGIMVDSLQGYKDGGWILLDYGVIVIHLMLPELREFYQLEELWSEGEKIEV